jgi:uncharacterized protein
MSSRGFDPTRLDVRTFAVESGELEGEWPLSSFERVAESAAPERPPSPEDVVAWSARGESRQLRGNESETWLHLHAATKVALQCQRCLAPVEVPVGFERKFLFVSGEDAAAQIDTTSEDDVLAMTRALDLHDLVEDELLLAMPLVPLHDVCPEPLPFVADDEEAVESPNPFAALAALKRERPLN